VRHNKTYRNQIYACDEENIQHRESISHYPSISGNIEPDIPSYGRGIKIGHVNIRNLMSKTKFHDLQSLIINHRYDVFAISETWLWKNKLNDDINVSGYKMFRADRCNIKFYNNRGAGVVVYVNED
jgi:hypothetical protein